MKWTTELVTVCLVDFDGDLKHFWVYNLEESFLGEIRPDNIEDMNHCIEALDNGECPIRDMWEDGNGISCTIDGWTEWQGGW